MPFESGNSRPLVCILLITFYPVFSLPVLSYSDIGPLLTLALSFSFLFSICLVFFFLYILGTLIIFC